MSAPHSLANFAKSTWRIAVQPALFARNREGRYRAAGLVDAGALATMRVALRETHADSEARCAYMARLTAEHLGDYRRAGQDWRWRPWLGTAAAISLGDHRDADAYLAAVGRRTGKAFTRSVAKARRLGYRTGLFAPQCCETSLAGILGSRFVRSGGIVPYALLPGRRPAPDTVMPEQFRPRTWCRQHWTVHFGVFAAGGADAAGGRLVGFVKLRRAGTLVHALQIMGHGDHMAAGINDLLQADLMTWLLADPDGLARGTTHYLYGAIEHSGDGLAQWKLRRGFVPMLVGVE